MFLGNATVYPHAFIRAEPQGRIAPEALEGFFPLAEI